jgi:hypothetical protein
VAGVALPAQAEEPAAPPATDPKAVAAEVKPSLSEEAGGEEGHALDPEVETQPPASGTRSSRTFP